MPYYPSLISLGVDLFTDITHTLDNLKVARGGAFVWSYVQNHLQHYRLDDFNPLLVVFTCDECIDGLEDRIAEPADVEDRGVVRRLSVAYWRQVDVDHLGLRIAGLVLLPFVHGRRRPTDVVRPRTATQVLGVDPRLVVRDVDDQISLGLGGVCRFQRGRAVGTTTADLAELLGVRHDRVTAVQAHVVHTSGERHHIGDRVGAQHARGDERSNILAGYDRSRTRAVAGDRRTHRAGHILVDLDAFNREGLDVLGCDLHCVLKRVANLRRDFLLVRLHVSYHELVWEHLGLKDRLGVTQLGCDHSDSFLVLEYSVTRKRVEVHAQEVPVA